MKYFQRFQTYPEFLSGQAVEARVEVEQIKSQLLMIRSQLTKNFIDEQSLLQNIDQAQKAQVSFHERVESVSQSLASYKLRLASFHS